ncbi:fimbrial protein [Comamonas sp. GB3 AK4-5]|uniref:fimbrial protein n=1 Tax=Comamonas sp. GB3 AK4-5 TaxID=3231487 RepID=UPI00351E6DF4
MSKYHYRFILKYIFLLFVFNILAFHSINTHAQPYCSSNGALVSNGWKMSPPGSSFTNGQVIGSTRASITYSMPIPQNAPIITAGGLNALNHDYDAVPMPQTPGVGVRVKWGGHYTTSSINVSLQYPPGAILTKISWQNIFKATARSSFSVIFYYDYEIVIIDKDKYKGGKLIITDSNRVIAITSTARPGLDPQQCYGGGVNLMTAVTNELNVPELPEPAIPTCASADISLNAKMNSINASQIAAYGSSRNSGTAGELYFRLIGRNCPKGTVINAYFTDARSPSASNNYLNSSNQSVGVRLYYDQSQTPIQFGPAPVGSTLPSRPPITEGPVTVAMGNLYIPITAQYVRLPNAEAGAVKAGDMQAATTVSFVYD